MIRKRILRYRAGTEKLVNTDQVHPLLARIYRNRKIVSVDELDKSLQQLAPYSLLKGIDTACDLLEHSLLQAQRIVIIGDFDADGATSTAVAVRALRMMGAQEVEFLVPNRFAFGYGLSPEIVDEAAKLDPTLIVTVDNGIANIDGVNRARQLGIKVLITDHHLAGDELPDADAIVNPNQPGDEFPAKGTAGVGVIFYVMLALRARLRNTGWFASLGIEEPNLAQLLDIVALGTVADVVPLEKNNRILVAQGLKRIRAGMVCPGIRALLEVSGRRIENVVSSDFGFAIGPRLNAAGRLDDMSIGIQCLLSDDFHTARLFAEQLHQLNNERKQIESAMQEQALEILESLRLSANDEIPKGITLFNPEWHQGVIGILASRIKDRYHRPTIVFAQDNPADVKGSARSIPGIHIRDILDRISKRHPGLLKKFGGHAMAAGLSLSLENLDQFSSAFDEEISGISENEEIEGTIHSDGELEQDSFSIDIAQMLRSAEPWGQSFPEPLFDGYFIILEQRVVGEKHLKLRLRPLDSTHALDAIAFGVIDASADYVPFEAGNQIHIAYRLDVNEFRGRQSLQLMIEHIQQADDVRIEVCNVN
ncbi:MAG: single-stranded-DNA-specific exonuclease RecJ [Gammaproteobacteria bacterium]|nr:single-stranded-DNA-specific exonuclease RecJ [Gammaproteobacteria bacterium]